MRAHWLGEGSCVLSASLIMYFIPFALLVFVKKPSIVEMEYGVRVKG